MNPNLELAYSQPLFSAYHGCGSVGVIIDSNPTHNIWYFNNAVHWKCSTKFVKGFCSPELYIESIDIWNVYFAEKRCINFYYLYTFLRDKIIHVIATLISQGYYIYFGGVDDYYVKGKSMYHDKHFLHDGLIIGYDLTKQNLKLVAYDQRWIYRPFNTPLQSFLDGLNAGYEQDSSSGNFFACKVTDEKIVLDTNKIICDLHMYLDHQTNCFPSEQDEWIYGIDVYDYILLYLKYIGKNVPFEYVDHRVFRAMYEHKHCMFLRIQYIESLLSLKPYLSIQYKEVVDLMNRLRLSYSVFILNHSSDLILQIQSGLIKAKKLEEAILHDFEKMLIQNQSKINNIKR